MITAESVRQAFGYFYKDELEFLKKLVASLTIPKPIVVNIGSGAGTSGLAILEARGDVVLVTIDITDESNPFGCLEAERDVVKRAGLGDLWMERWFQIKGRSQDIAVQWNTSVFGSGDKSFMMVGEVDMVFVDGDHSYQGCHDDIARWLINLRPGGIIAVHDYEKHKLPAEEGGPHPMPWPGVDLAVRNMLIPNYPMIGHVKSLIAFNTI